MCTAMSFAAPVTMAMGYRTPTSILPATQRIFLKWTGWPRASLMNCDPKPRLTKAYSTHGIAIQRRTSIDIHIEPKKVAQRAFSTTNPRIAYTKAFPYPPFNTRGLGSYTSSPEPLIRGQDDASKLPGQAKVAEMHFFVAEYTANLPQHIPYDQVNFQGGEVVFVTGTTGALGANILAQLLEDPEVVRVYAVNRFQKEDVSLRTKQLQALKDRGLRPSLIYSPKLVLVEADTTMNGLGISKNLYHEIKNSVTVIMHNAWPVHFKRELSTFEPVIRGLRNLIDLALGSPRKEPPRMMFTSSAGVFWNYDSSQIIPEAAVDAHTAVGSGYTESKWVAERMLEICAEKTPLNPIIVRVGQLCGGINGAWNTKEWFPSLLRSGQALGCLAMREEDISWLPVHNAATALIEIWRTPTRYLTLAHPRSVSWDKIFVPLSTSLGVPLVPYPMWLEALQRSADVVHNPTLRLLDFYQASSALGIGCARLSTVNAQRASPTLASLRPLLPGDVNRWVAYWRRVNFLW